MQGFYQVVWATIAATIGFLPYFAICRWTLGTATAPPSYVFALMITGGTFLAVYMKPHPLVLKLGVLAFIMYFSAFHENPATSHITIFTPIVTMMVGGACSVLSNFVPYPVFASTEADEELKRTAEALCNCFLLLYKIFDKENVMSEYFAKEEVQREIAKATALLKSSEEFIALTKFEFILPYNKSNLSKRTSTLKAVLNSIESMYASLNHPMDSAIKSEIVDFIRVSLHESRNACIVAMMNSQKYRSRNVSYVLDPNDRSRLHLSLQNSANVYLDARRRILWEQREEREWTMRQLLHINTFLFYNSYILRAVLFDYYGSSESALALMALKTSNDVSTQLLLHATNTTGGGCSSTCCTPVDPTYCGSVFSRLADFLSFRGTIFKSTSSGSVPVDPDTAHKFKHAFQVSLAVFISLIIPIIPPMQDTLNFSLWTTFTIVFIADEFVGGTSIASIRRVAGTVLGGISGALILVVSLDNQPVLLTLLFVWVFLSAYVGTHPSYGYIGKVSAFTSVIILLGYSSTSTDSIRAFAYKRIEQTYYGVIVYLLVMSLVFPVLDTTLARNRVRTVIKDIHMCINNTFNAYYNRQTNHVLLPKMLTDQQEKVRKLSVRVVEVVEAANLQPSLWRKEFLYEPYLKACKCVGKISTHLLRMRLAMERMVEKDYTTKEGAVIDTDPSRMRGSQSNPATKQMEVIHNHLIVYMSTMMSAMERDIVVTRETPNAAPFDSATAWNETLRKDIKEFSRLLDEFTKVSVHERGSNFANHPTNLDVLSYNSFIASMEDLIYECLSLGLTVSTILEGEKRWQ